MQSFLEFSDFLDFFSLPSKNCKKTRNEYNNIKLIYAMQFDMTKIFLLIYDVIYLVKKKFSYDRIYLIIYIECSFRHL